MIPAQFPKSVAGGLAQLLPRHASALELLATPVWSSTQRSAFGGAPGEKLITILHTNDTHSQIDPLPANDRQYPDKGGVARRATLVKRDSQGESEHASG